MPFYPRFEMTGLHRRKALGFLDRTTGSNISQWQASSRALIRLDAPTFLQIEKAGVMQASAFSKQLGSWRGFAAVEGRALRCSIDKLGDLRQRGPNAKPGNAMMAAWASRIPFWRCAPARRRDEK